MIKKAVFFVFILGTVLSWYVRKPAIAQETFGPTCEVGVTCSPTQPLVTNTPLPTSTPKPTATPRPTLPVTGPMEVTYSLLGLGALILFLGMIGTVSLGFRRS